MIVLLDTGILIRHLRGRREIVRLVRGLKKQNRLAISAVTRTEIIAGMRDDEMKVMLKLFSRMQSYGVDSATADRAGELMRRGQMTNEQIALPDALIAATALTHNLTLVTLNEKHFRPIRGLSLYPLDIQP